MIPGRMFDCGMLNPVAAVQDAEYLKIASDHYAKLKNWKADNYAYDWDNKSPALHVLFNQATTPEAAM